VLLQHKPCIWKRSQVFFVVRTQTFELNNLKNRWSTQICGKFMHFVLKILYFSSYYPTQKFVFWQHKIPVIVFEHKLSKIVFQKTYMLKGVFYLGESLGLGQITGPLGHVSKTQTLQLVLFTCNRCPEIGDRQKFALKS
jgi:hypothetical protein